MTHRTILDVQKVIAAMVTAAVTEWWTNPLASYPCLYLYCKPSTETEDGALTICEDAPEGYELATNDYISPAMSQPQVYNLVRNLAQRLPLLKYGKGV